MQYAMGSSAHLFANSAPKNSDQKIQEAAIRILPKVYTSFTRLTRFSTCSDAPQLLDKAASGCMGRRRSASLRRLVRFATACALAFVFAIPHDVLAQSHVVSLAELQSATVASAETRQKDIDTIGQFVSSPTAEKALKSAHMDAQQVKEAVSRLSDQELSQLAARASKAQADFAAGRISSRTLIIIVVVVVATILIIVAVR
jgi:hypothetical protein